MDAKSKIIEMMERFLHTGQAAERNILGEEIIEAFMGLDLNVGNPPFERRVKQMIIAEIRTFTGCPEARNSLRENLAMVKDMLS